MFGKSKKSKGRRTAGRGASRTRRKDSGGRTAVRGRKKAAGQGSGRGRFFTRWQAVAVAAVLVAFLGWMAWRSDYVQMRFVYMWPYQREIVTYSQKNRVDPFLVAAVIKNESRFKPGAVSGVGAIGLMQIMPDTGGWIAKQMGLKNYELQSLYNPETNIRMGCWFSCGPMMMGVKRSREYAKLIPADKLLLETDFPPHDHRAEPAAWAREVRDGLLSAADSIALARKCNTLEVLSHTKENSLLLLS